MAQWRRYTGIRKGNPLQYPCLEISKDRPAWWVIVHGLAKESDMTEHTHTGIIFLLNLILYVYKIGIYYQGCLFANHSVY